LELGEKLIMKTTLVMGGKGGCGVTAAVVNLAQAAAEAGHKTLAVDLHPRQGGLALALNLHPETVWQDAVESGDDPASAIIEAGPPGMACLPARFGLEAASRPMRAPAEPFLNTLSEGRDWALADAESCFCPLALAEAPSAHQVLIVATPEPASTLGAITALASARKAGFSGEAWLMLNFADSASQAARVHERLEMLAARVLSLELRMAGWVARDDRAALATRRGATVLDAAPKSAAAEGFRRCASALLSGIEADSPTLKGRILAWLPAKKAA
jgi:flagellar biosynthesis protein FlhG